MSDSVVSEADFYRRENDRLREDVSYLNRKCEELMAGQNDDAMIALLKNRINDLDKYIEEVEKQHEEQIHQIKLERNAAQKESNMLRAANKELEAIIRQLEGGESDARVLTLERRIKELEESLKREYGQRLDAESRLTGAKEQIASMDVSRNSGPSVAIDAQGRKILRKRPMMGNSRPSSSQSRHEEPVTEKHIKNLQGDEELKRLLTQAIEEKNRLEKVNKDLSNKIMLLMKTYEEEQAKGIRQEKKKGEYAILATKRELEDVMRIKEENEKKLFGEIIKLEKKISEREKQIEVYGIGIETLKKELQLREDPSHSAGQIVKYLEKYAKFQNEFMSNEVKRFQDDFNQLKTDVNTRETEIEQNRKKQIDLWSKFESINNEYDMQKELLQLKTEEITALKQENNALVVAMELLRKEKTQVANIRKANSELVIMNKNREIS